MTVTEQVGSLIDLVQAVQDRVLTVGRLLSAGEPPAEIMHASRLAHDLRPVLAMVEVRAEMWAAELRAVRADGIRHGFAKGHAAGIQEGRRQVWAELETADQGTHDLPCLRAAGRRLRQASDCSGYLGR